MSTKIRVSESVILLIVVIFAALPGERAFAQDASLKHSEHQLQTLTRFGNGFQNKLTTEPNKPHITAEYLYAEALSFVDKDMFSKAWPMLVQARDIDSNNLVYRNSLFVLRELSSIHIRIQKAENMMTADLAIESNDSRCAELQKILYDIRGIKIEDDQKFAAFRHAKERMDYRISSVANNCRKNQEICLALESATNAFKKGDYKQELNFLKEAVELDSNNTKQLAQCKYFVDGMLFHNEKQYEKAENIFSNIEPSDRHYTIARQQLEEIKQMVQIRNFEQQLNEAWAKLDWKKLEELAATNLEEKVDAKSSRLSTLLGYTRNILNDRRLYVSTKNENDFGKNVGLLKQIEENLTSASALDNNKEKYAKALAWTKKELDILMPHIQTEIDKLIQKASASIADYNRSPITVEQINSWTAETNYEPIMATIKYLCAAYQDLSDANTLSELNVNKAESLRVIEKFEWVKSEIKDKCGKSFKRAYILERNHGERGTAEKIYKVCEAMPAFEGNDGREWARIRLEKLQNQEK